MLSPYFNKTIFNHRLVKSFDAVALPLCCLAQWTNQHVLPHALNSYKIVFTKQKSVATRSEQKAEMVKHWGKVKQKYENQLTNLMSARDLNIGLTCCNTYKFV